MTASVPSVQAEGVVPSPLAEARPEFQPDRGAFPVALVSMPFALSSRPSLQLGLLSELARARGFSVDTMHLNLDFVDRIGDSTYLQVACTRNPMLGDWLFSPAAFRQEAPDPRGVLATGGDPAMNASLELVGLPAAELRRLRDTVVPAYVDDMVSTVDWDRYRVVAFTSTFQQNSASFALARRLKEERPSISIVFGGANFDGPMGTAWMRAIPWIDWAISGEADVAWPALLERLCGGRDPFDVPGVIGRRNGEVVATPPGALLERLDDLPIPDYAEYFERAERLGLLPRSSVRRVDIPFESARGCWWGEKATCRFCGLNATGMTFRAKTPMRVLHELEVLARRHGSLMFTAADNILDPSYLRSLMAPLAASETDYWIFYETKANISRDDLRLLHRAGVRALQPGIESLSTALLQRMAKGTRASQNVNFLRWARYYGIEVYWNVLLGFPGETEDDYAEQVRLARSLVHLDPPGGSVRIGLERFSPYFEDRSGFPVRNGEPQPEAGYKETYPASVDLRAAAYHFMGELEGSLPDDAYAPLVRTLKMWNDRWQSAANPPTLRFWWTRGLLQIEDGRSALAAATYRFDDPLAALYVACSDRPRPAAVLKRQLALAEPEVEIARALDEFCRRGLMMRDGRDYLALALPATEGR